MTPEQYAEYHRNWRKEHNERAREIQRQWYHRNKEFLKQQKKLRN